MSRPSRSVVAFDWSRIMTRVEDGRNWARTPRVRRRLLFGAVALFAGGLAWSIVTLPEGVRLVAIWPLAAVAVIGVAARLALAAAELKFSARLIGAGLSWPESTRVSLMASAANLLPLPGGPVVRIAALNLAGGTLSGSGGVTVLTAMNWLGLALCYAGSWMLSNQPSAALVFLLAGLAPTLVSVVLMWRVGRQPGVVVALVLIKAATIAVGLLRLHWVFSALGLSLEADQLAVFAVSGVVGSIVAIVPAGIGINEAAAALLAPLVGLDPATAFLATSLNRLIGLPILLMLAFAVALKRSPSESNP